MGLWMISKYINEDDWEKYAHVPYTYYDGHYHWQKRLLNIGSPLFFINQPTDDPDIDGAFGLALDFSKHAGGSETAGRHSKQHLTIMSFW
jgi:hypothetical protein